MELKKKKRFSAAYSKVFKEQEPTDGGLGAIMTCERERAGCLLLKNLTIQGVLTVTKQRLPGVRGGRQGRNVNVHLTGMYYVFKSSCAVSVELPTGE